MVLPDRILLVKKNWFDPS